MKKIISVILTLAMLCGIFTISAYGISEQSEITKYPLIIVAGYSSTNLFKINDDGTEDKLWGIGVNEILDLVLKNIAQLARGLGESVFGQPDYLAKLLGEKVGELMGDMACNDDGTSRYNVRVMFEGAEKSNSQVMYEEYDETEDYQFETDIARCCRKYIDRKMIFNFNVDWRMGAVQCANDLDRYIQEVKEYSGCEKVNLMSISHGGQVAGTYLTLFGYKQDVDNAVLNVPALGGAGVLYDILGQTVKLDEYQLIRFIEHGMCLEDDYHFLLEAQQLGFLDEVLNKAIPYLFEVCGNWGSIWDFCPIDIYEDMKAKWLDKEKNAGLIAKSDYMHYEIMPKFYTALNDCNTKYGMNVNIIAGTDIDLSGCRVNGDGIISTPASTGATCAKIGERFPDGYTQINPCGGKNKVSPAMTVDASTAYMPDNTWFINELFHGMMVWDMFSRELLITLLLTDEITDVYSDPDYPQFHTSTNPSNAISAKFNKSVEGFVSSDDTSVIITNYSEKDYDTTILGITCDGLDLDFDLKPFTVIKAGESIEVPFSGEIPAVSATRADLIVSYFAKGSVTPQGDRKIPFTITNGNAPASGGGFVSSAVKTPFDNSVFSFLTDILKALGLYTCVTTKYTVMYDFFHQIFG